MLKWTKLKQIRPSKGFDYYDPSTVFFNSFEIFAQDWNLKITGSPDVYWFQHLLATRGRFDDPLFISCGNGNVERTCFGTGLISRATGFDILPELIEQARAGAAEIGMPADYSVEDGNAVILPKGRHDLVVNHAACHHIAYLDRLLRQVHRTLKADGHFVMLDYTGPHRNQYGWAAWDRIVQANADLPDEYRTPVQYPHQPTMIALDPTEAIHSELIMDHTRRYFDIEEHAVLGGGLVHQLLFGKAAMLADQHKPEVAARLRDLLAADDALTAEHPETNLFTFAVCRPKAPEAMPDTEQLRAWEAEEQEREARAAENGGRYYPAGSLEMIYDQHAAELAKKRKRFRL